MLIGRKSVISPWKLTWIFLAETVYWSLPIAIRSSTTSSRLIYSFERTSSRDLGYLTILDEEFHIVTRSASTMARNKFVRSIMLSSMTKLFCYLQHDCKTEREMKLNLYGTRYVTRYICLFDLIRLPASTVKGFFVRDESTVPCDASVEILKFLKNCTIILHSSSSVFNDNLYFPWPFSV